MFRNKVKLLKGFFLFLIVGLFVLLIAQAIFIQYGLRYVDIKYYEINIGMTHNMVRSKLSNFREYEVNLKDIPENFRNFGQAENLIFIKDTRIFRYDFNCLFITISLHIIYDKYDKVALVIPTYE